MTLLMDSLEELGAEYVGANWLTTAMNCGVKRNTDPAAPFPYVLTRDDMPIGYADIQSLDVPRSADIPLPVDARKLVSVFTIGLPCYLVVIWHDSIGLIDLTSLVKR